MGGSGSDEEFKEDKPKGKKSPTKKRDKDGKPVKEKKEKKEKPAKEPKEPKEKKEKKLTKKELAELEKKKNQVGAGKVKEKCDIMDIPTTKKTIEEYMIRHNRPYSV